MPPAVLHKHPEGFGKFIAVKLCKLEARRLANTTRHAGPSFACLEAVLDDLVTKRGIGWISRPFTLLVANRCMGDISSHCDFVNHEVNKKVY